jgi:hypothetical protein
MSWGNVDRFCYLQNPEGILSNTPVAGLDHAYLQMMSKWISVTFEVIGTRLIPPVIPWRVA